jgi:hypothetical protein
MENKEKIAMLRICRLWKSDDVINSPDGQVSVRGVIKIVYIKRLLRCYYLSSFGNMSLILEE